MFKSLICGLCVLSSLSVNAMQENRVDVYRRANLEAAAGTHINAHLEGFMQARGDLRAVDSIVSALEFFRKHEKFSFLVETAIEELRAQKDFVGISGDNDYKCVMFAISDKRCDEIGEYFKKGTRIQFNSKFNIRFVLGANDDCRNFGIRVERSQQKDKLEFPDDDIFGYVDTTDENM